MGGTACRRPKVFPPNLFRHFVTQRREFYRQELCPFQEAAEIFLAGDVLGAFFIGEAEQGFIFHLQPFQPHNADIFLALFPDLALAQFHRDSIPACRRPWRQDLWPERIISIKIAFFRESGHTDLTC